MTRILMIYTGGTIGMRPGPDGLVPGDDFEQRARAQLRRLPGHRRRALPEFSCLSYPDPIDSSNARPRHWTRLAQDIMAHQAHHDGIVVLHGTDTLAWTAASLHWQLRGLDKAIVISGAQQPLEAEQSDALANLEQALHFAAQPRLSGVAVAFGGLLLEGVATRKWDTHDVRGFASPNAAPLGEWINGQAVLYERTSHGRALPSPAPVSPPAGPIIRIALWPGIDAGILSRLLGDDVLGVVLEVWGSGNIPEEPSLLDLLAQATRRGCLIVAISQCPHGTTQMGHYATGQTLKDSGVIDGLTMSPEAAFTRLNHLLGLGYDAATCRRCFHDW